jgi:hypothetical protein
MKFNIVQALLASLWWSLLFGGVALALIAVKAPNFLALPVILATWAFCMFRVWKAGTKRP